MKKEYIIWWEGSNYPETSKLITKEVALTFIFSDLDKKIIRLSPLRK